MRLALLSAVACAAALLGNADAQVHRCAAADGTVAKSGTNCARQDATSTRERLRATHGEKLDRVRCKLARGRLSAKMQLDPSGATHAREVTELRQKTEHYCGLQAAAG